MGDYSSTSANSVQGKPYFGRFEDESYMDYS